jgi:hypothetical protein
MHGNVSLFFELVSVNHLDFQGHGEHNETQSSQTFMMFYLFLCAALCAFVLPVQTQETQGH